MSNGIVRYVMQVVGGAQVRQALRGVVAETRGADRQIAQSGQLTARARARAALGEVSDARRGAQARVRVETEADRAILRSARETSREQRRLRLAEERDMRRSLRGQGQQGQGGRGGVLRAVGSAALGVAQATLGRVEGWQSALGVGSRDELIQRSMRSQLALIRATSGAGMSDEESTALQARVTEVARRTGADPTSLVDGLVVAQNRFSELRTFSDNLEEIAFAARAVDAPIGDMVGALGEFHRQMGVSSEEMPQMLGLMADGMNQGSLEAGDVAANFSTIMSDFTALRGEGGRGAGGAREFLALAQALGAKGAGPEGTRTLMQNLMTNLQRSEHQRELERAMGDRSVFNDQGQLTISFAELIQRMADNPRLENARVMEDIFGNDQQAASARSFLMEQTRNGANPIETLMGVSGTRGNEFIERVNERIDGSAAGEAGRIAARTEADFMDNGESLIRTMNDAVGPLSALTSQYPLATEALGWLWDAATAAAGALGTLGLINMATGGAVGSGVSAALSGAASTAATGAAAMLGTAASVLAPAALATFAFQGSAGGTRDLTEAEQEAQAQRRERFTGEALRLMRDPTALGMENTAEMQPRRAAFRAQAVAAAESGQMVDRAFLEQLAQRMGVEVARAIDRGAPAAGREPGEPGRRR